MKKFLSLALALAMAFSLIVIQTPGAGAAFTDNANINYKEAVDVISALKIMDGYADGSFLPGNGLSRGAATKIICNVLLTPSVADQMPRSANDFTDVASGSTFAGYIHYCYDQGIIGGYGGGKFGPADGLSGYAFLKMLLGALGYDQVLEHYQGSGWQINVQNQALTIGLTDGITSFDGNAQVNRETATQMVLNALQADMVEYTGSTAATRRVVTSSKSSASNISSTQNNSQNILQLAEDRFPGLVRTGSTEDAFGRPSTGWKLSGADVGTYNAKAAKTYYGDVTTGTIYNDLGMSVSSSNVTLYLNGVKDSGASLSISRNGNARLSSASSAAADAIGNGCEIQVFRDDNNAVTICVVTYYAGTVSNVYAGSSSRARTISIAAAPGKAPDTFDASNRFETTAYAAGDVVGYTWSGKSGASGVQDVFTLTEVKGSLDRYVSGTSLTIEGVTYTYAKKVGFGGSLSGESDLKSGYQYSGYILYVDNAPILMWVENAAASVDGHALVLAVSPGSNFSSPKARLLLPDGSTKDVDLDADFANENVIVRYAVKNGKYSLTQLGASEFSESTSSFSIANRVANGLGDYNGSPISADNNTVFVVKEGDNYAVYTGVRNVRNVSGDSARAYTYHDKGTAKIVFVTGGTVTSASRDLTFIAATSHSNLIHDGSTTNGYRTFNAVIGGTITTIKVENGSAMDAILSANSYSAEDSAVFNNVSRNTNGIAVSGEFSGSASTLGKGAGLSAPTSGGQITVGGTRLYLSDSLAVWYADEDGEIRSISRNEINSDSNDVVYYVLNDGDVTALFIVQEV